MTEEAGKYGFWGTVQSWQGTLKWVVWIGGALLAYNYGWANDGLIQQWVGYALNLIQAVVPG